MDCGTCDSAPTLQVHAPEVVDVSLTMTDKATSMLEDAFGDDAATPCWWVFSAVVAPATCTTCKSLNQPKHPAKN